jgi:hypothetical protein
MTKKRSRTVQSIQSIVSKVIGVGLLDGSICFLPNDPTAGSFLLRQSHILTLEMIRAMEDGPYHFSSPEKGTVRVEFGSSIPPERVRALSLLGGEPDRTTPLPGLEDLVSKNDMKHYLKMTSMVTKSLLYHGNPIFKLDRKGSLIMIVRMESVWSSELLALVDRYITDILFYGEENELRVQLTILKPIVGQE